MISPKTIFIACPWTPLGGGMFKVADYLIQSQGDPEQAEDARLVPLDTRGGLGASFSVLVMPLAIGKLILGRLSGKVAGVHVNMAERLSLFRKGVIIAACRMLRLPCVLHLHAAQLHHFYRTLPPLLQRLTRWFFASSTRCVVLGHAAETFVTRELGLPDGKVEIVINGVPPPICPRRVRSRHGIFRVLFLGNLSERKGMSDLLRAIALSGYSSERLEVRIAGGGDIARYKSLCSELGIDTLVHFEGWSDQAKAARLMADADVLILPSYDEGLPLVILEALANGVAVICTPVGEIPGALADGVNACFVAAGDPASIAAGLHRVLDNDSFRETLERNGRQIYESQFSMARFFQRISSIHRAQFGVCARLGQALGGAPR